ncbi:hypothetical protein N7G274_008430 [Stereocaulon virgatum]|uniref:Uncharacterized protein n=1 Tax=Stereocaulon virgatum TaxID=373712 RepID=A0ABR4A2R5_9LECA
MTESRQACKPAGTAAAPYPRLLLVLTFDSSTYTADPSSDFVIAGQTLTPGSGVTVSGTPIYYAAAGMDVAVGSSTDAVVLGGLVVSGVGNGIGGAVRCGVLERCVERIVDM